MLKHHEIAFTAGIDALVRFGATTLPWDDLHLWFKVEEIDQSVWRAIYAKYNELWLAYEWGELPELHALQLEGRLTLMRDAADGEELSTFNEEGELEESEDEEEESEEDTDGEEEADSDEVA